MQVLINPRSHALCWIIKIKIIIIFIRWDEILPTLRARGAQKFPLTLFNLDPQVVHFSDLYFNIFPCHSFAATFD